MKSILFLLIAALALAVGGCNSQNTNEAANEASRKVSNAANTVANKTSEVAQNVNKSAGPTINDATMTTRIKAKLLADSITGTTVDTTNGVVTLTGAVGSDEEKAKAEKHAQETEGVKSVKNELVVKSQ
jgi:hyperosmotically inducible periplasmic protein